MRDIRLIPWHQLGYRHPSHVYNGEPDMPHGQQYVSAADNDDPLFAYAVTRGGTPRLVWLADGLSVFANKGHRFTRLLATHVPFRATTIRVGGIPLGGIPYTLLWADLPDIRKQAPAVLSRESGAALFNLYDALRLLEGYDALQAKKRAERAARRKAR